MTKAPRYAIVVFLIWTCSPFILAAIQAAISSVFVGLNFFFYLIFPALILSLVALGISRIKDSSLRVGLFYGVLGFSIWLSPAIYFLRDSQFYISLPIIIRNVILILPAAVLASLFFYMGKNKDNPQKDITDLYVKHALYSSSGAPINTED